VTPELKERIVQLKARGFMGEEIRIALPDKIEAEAVVAAGSAGPVETKPVAVPTETTKTEWQSGTIPANKFSLLKASGLPKKRIRWLWPDRIALGKLTTFAGMPGEAKGLTTVDITAVVTTNRPAFGDGAPNTLGRPRDVLFVTSEDDFEDTINPRLIAAGADLDRVHFLKSSAFGTERLISLDTDLTEIERCLRENPDIVLVVIDPVLNHLGKKKANDTQDVRSVLARLKFPGVATIIVLHMNKKSDLNAIQRVSGAGAFIEVARTAWLFTSDPDDPEEIRKMLLIKGNVIKRSASGMEFKVVSKPVALDDGVADVPFIAWVGATSQTANDALASDGRPPKSGPQGGSLEDAKAFLLEYLKDGPQLAAILLDRAIERGFSERTLRTAKKDLKIESDKTGGIWRWYLPGQDCKGGSV
jgi:putative DNA primase/helicase